MKFEDVSLSYAKQNSRVYESLNDLKNQKHKFFLSQEHCFDIKSIASRMKVQIEANTVDFFIKHPLLYQK